MSHNISDRKSYLIALYSFVIGMFVFLFAFVSMYFNNGIGMFNKPLLSWLINNRNETVTYIAKMITTLANPSTFILIGITIIVFGIIKKEYYRPALIVGALALSAATSFTLKNAIMDVRPPLSSMVPLFEMDYSFPSGHTLSTIVFLLVLGYIFYSRNFSKVKFYVWILIALLGASIMALTRLYLGYHWLTDVVASFGLGFVILSIVVLVDKFITDKYPDLK